MLESRQPSWNIHDTFFFAKNCFGTDAAWRQAQRIKAVLTGDRTLPDHR
jgi:hypothetical protein